MTFQISKEGFFPHVCAKCENLADFLKKWRLFAFIGRVSIDPYSVEWAKSRDCIDKNIIGIRYADLRIRP